MKKLIVLFFLSIISICTAQKKPKLVVGIVVDQMRYDYLLRFKSKFGNKGFQKLINEGVNFENTHYNYIPTYTAVGHTSIYTGATPKSHGIISNNWYDKKIKKSIYVVDDSKFETIGSNSNNGQKSPKRLIASTVADQLKLAQNFKGKCIGVAIKDRSAILPVGHSADIAYWFDDGNNGKWISSSYYAEKLPNWVTQYNQTNKEILDTYLNKPWVTKLDIDNYKESSNDNQHYEVKHKNEKAPIFPHQLPDLKSDNGNYSLLKKTPYGNTITFDFAKQIVLNEKLGKDKVYSDFLAISLSSPDYIGHMYGPASKEIEDTYIRLNDELDDFLKFLNQKVGKNNYVLVLTADHAVSQVPHHLMENKIPGGYTSMKEVRANLLEFTFSKYKSTTIVENISNNQIFLNYKEIKSLNLSVSEVENSIVQEMIYYPNIYKAISATSLTNNEFSRAPFSLLQEGYNQKISGNILFLLKPSVIYNGYLKGGTTHGSGYNYDTHVPLLFYGAGIKEGVKFKQPVEITQIAPTLSNLLQIQEPNMSSNNILYQAFATE